MKRILILHASAGAGHTRAAAALAQAFSALAPDAMVTTTDILDFTPALYRDTYAKGYLRVVRAAPELWGYMYAVSDRKARNPWRRKVRSTFNAINAASFRSFLRDNRPDLIVCTHFMPLELLTRRSYRRITSAPLYCVVTDYAVHSLWVSHDVTGYFVATDDAREQLELRVDPQTAVTVAGIPIDDAFRHPPSTAEARRSLGIRPDLPTVLVLNGGMGVGPAAELLRSFDGHPSPLQLLVVAGGSAEQLAQCEVSAARLALPVRIFGFVKNIPELMAAADVVVSKSGGLTCSEVMAMGKPMVIVNPIPGQEQRNCDYLIEAGAATRLHEMEVAAAKLGRLVADHQRLATMRANARRVGRPDAAREIAASILQAAPQGMS